MVDREHIASLVRTAVQGPSGRGVSVDTAWHRLSFYTRPMAEMQELNWAEMHQYTFQVEHNTGSELGELLRRENVESLRARYADADEVMIPEWAKQPFRWSFSDGRRLTTVEALAAIDCYTYQACEHDGWHSSAAYSFCEAFRHALIGTLDGYTWNVDYGDPITRACDACGAAAGEPCNPFCVGLAAHEDAL